VTVLLHVPHAATAIPPEVRADLLLDDAGLARELLGSTDHRTDELVAGLADGRHVVAHVNRWSRLVVDPERFTDPALEPTEAVGRGVVYTRGYDGTPLRDEGDPDWPDRRAALIDTYFTPYHAEVERLVAEALATDGRCTIVDVHSYPTVAQPYELDPDGPRPPLCIGTDPRHTPGWLVEALTARARAAGLEVGLDRPFAGTFVPLPFLGDPRVASVMVELRRDTHLDEATGALHAGAAEVRAVLAGLVADLLAA